MNIGENIKKVRKEKGMLQKQVAAEVGLDQSNYNKIENGQRQPSIEVLYKLAKLFGMTTDQLINLEDGIPNEVVIEDEPLTQQLKLINQLEDDDRNVIFKMIDTMLTKKKFQDFFQKNLPATQ
jgi:transcriptional regulator with XRE-family HTH domain